MSPFWADGNSKVKIEWSHSANYGKGRDAFMYLANYHDPFQKMYGKLNTLRVIVLFPLFFTAEALCALGSGRHISDRIHSQGSLHGYLCKTDQDRFWVFTERTYWIKEKIKDDGATIKKHFQNKERQLLKTINKLIQSFCEIFENRWPFILAMWRRGINVQVQPGLGT